MENSEFYDYVGVAKDSVKQGLWEVQLNINWEITFMESFKYDYFMSSWS